MNDLVSIVIPTFKRPDRLKRTLRGILNQTYQEFQVLVIDDDPSENDLLSVVNEFEDRRISLHKNQRTKGANGARNTGCSLAIGKYIAFHDDDDEWMPIYLESQIETLSSKGSEYGLVYSNYYIEEDNKWLEKRQDFSGNILGDLISDRFRIGSGSNIFIRKEVLDKTGLWDEEMKRQQDLEFLVRVCHRFLAVPNESFGLKVYGHNDPDPSKTFATREFYFKKIAKYLELLNENDRQLFYSNHFRRQTNYLVKMKSYKKALEYWSRSRKSKKFVLRKDAKIMVSFFQSLI